MVRKVHVPLIGCHESLLEQEIAIRGHGDQPKARHLRDE
jgi:hypothetical protein